MNLKYARVVESRCRFSVMAANYIVNVPKLRGRENYDEWVFAAENFLILEGMMKCIKTEQDESGTEVIVSAADDAKTKAKLILTIDSSLYVHIKTVKTTKELWENSSRSLMIPGLPEG